MHLENADVPLVLEQNVGLVQERVPVHRPQAAAHAVVTKGPAIVRIVDVVVVHRRKPGENDGTVREVAGARRAA